MRQSHVSTFFLVLREFCLSLRRLPNVRPFSWCLDKADKAATHFKEGTPCAGREGYRFDKSGLSIDHFRFREQFNMLMN